MVATMGSRSGKPGPDPGHGPRLGKGAMPPGEWQKNDGAPKVTVRLAPDRHAWVMEQGGATFVRELVEEAFLESEGAIEDG